MLPLSTYKISFFYYINKILYKYKKKKLGYFSNYNYYIIKLYILIYGDVMVIILLAILFTTLQGIEYYVSSFTISDANFGSCFYFETGFHGLHVIIGTVFLTVGFWRILVYHLTNNLKFI